MNRYIDTKKIMILFFTVHLLLAGGLCFYVFTESEDITIKILVAFFSAITILLTIMLIFILRKKIRLFSREFIDIMDAMINDHDNITFDFNNESLSDKIGMKLKRLYEILRNAKEQSEKEKHALEEAITDISHQIKTPLTNLNMYNSTLLTREVPPKKREEFYLSMGRQIDKLNFLTTQMVKVSRMETGTIHLNMKKQKLYDTTAVALSGIVLSAERKNITVIPPAPTEIAIPHDSKWTAEALFNMLDNSVKYTEAGGEIRITIKQTDTTATIKIADTGKGIRKENIYKIFKRFFREEDVHEIEGIGIGLYLTHEIISKQNGSIQVKSDLGKGTSITVFLLNE